jgi:hypothetical protein
MHNAKAMRLMDRYCHVAHHQDFLLEREPLGHTLEGFTLDKLQGDIRAPANLTHFVDATDVRMVKSGLSARLTEEPCRHLRIRFQDELDRDDTIETAISGPIDQAHSPLTEEVK